MNFNFSSDDPELQEVATKVWNEMLDGGAIITRDEVLYALYAAIERHFDHVIEAIVPNIGRVLFPKYNTLPHLFPTEVAAKTACKEYESLIGRPCYVYADPYRPGFDRWVVEPCQREV